MFRINMNSYTKIGLLPTVFLLVACGGGGGSGGTVEPSFQDGPPRIELRVVPANARIPVNTAGVNAAYSQRAAEPYTVLVGVTASLGDVRTPAEINVSFKGNNDLLNLFTFLADDTDSCPDPSNPSETVTCHKAFSNKVFEGRSSVDAYFVASPRGIGGKQVIQIDAVFETRDGRTVQAQRELEITVGDSDLVPNYSYILDSGGGNIVAGNRDSIQLRIVDRTGAPVIGSSAYNSVQLELDSASFRAGGRLIGVTHDNQTMTSDKIQLSSARNAVVNFDFIAPNLDGTSSIQVLVDAADNNVSNGIQQPLSLGYITYNVRKLSVAERLTFTGDLANAAIAKANVLKFTDEDGGRLPGSGVATYERVVSVLVTDSTGRPAGIGEKVRFYLIDGPLTGFPASRGTFVSQGVRGNTQANSSVFLSTDSASNFAMSGPDQILPNLCHLVYGYGLEVGDRAREEDFAYAPYERGIRQITSIPSIPLIISELDPVRISVDRQFNPVVDTGFSVPWLVGCGGTVGALSNQGIATIQADGTAVLSLSHAVSQIGRRFVLVAEHIRPDGQTLSALLNHWYLASEVGATLSVAPKVMTINASLTAEQKSGDIRLRLINQDGIALANQELFCSVTLTVTPTACDRDNTTNTATLDKSSCQNATFQTTFEPAALVTDNSGQVTFQMVMNGWPKFVGADYGTIGSTSTPGTAASEVTKGKLSCSTLNTGSESGAAQTVEMEFNIR